MFFFRTVRKDLLDKMIRWINGFKNGAKKEIFLGWIYFQFITKQWLYSTVATACYDYRIIIVPLKCKQLVGLI